MSKSQKRRFRQKHDRPARKTDPPANTRSPQFKFLITVLVVGLAGVLIFAIVKASHRGRVPEVATRQSNALTLTHTSTMALTSITNAPDPDTAAAALNAKGNELLKAGDIQGGIRSYREALALTPNDEDLHFNLGLAYARLGDLTNAEAEYRVALRLLPDFPEVHNNLGKVLLRSGKLTEAEREFNEAIEQMPEYAQAHNNLGILYQQQKRTQDAILSFQKATQYETNYWEAHFNLAGAYIQQHDKDKAIAELRETLRINPGFQAAQRILAQMTEPNPKPNPNPAPTETNR